MPWGSSENAGFSQAAEGELWLPVDPEYKTTNLEAQAQDPYSSFSLYRTLLHLRNATPVLRRGTYAPLLSSHPDVVSFARRDNADQTMTLVNFSDREQSPRIGGAQQIIGRVVVSSITPHPNRLVSIDEPITLQPNEALIVARSA
jgi:glycosidase